jgi:hypothetical protein
MSEIKQYYRKLEEKTQSQRSTEPIPPADTPGERKRSFSSSLKKLDTKKEMDKLEALGLKKQYEIRSDQLELVTSKERVRSASVGGPSPTTQQVQLNKTPVVSESSSEFEVGLRSNVF